LTASLDGGATAPLASVLAGLLVFVIGLVGRTVVLHRRARAH
jgi:hypothetical protein